MGKDDHKALKSERRKATRHVAYFPAHLGDSESLRDMTLIRDVSVTGAALLTRKPLEVGATLDLALMIGEEKATRPRQVQATVVRTKRRDSAQGGLWKHEAAVTFAEPQAELEAEFKALEAAQRELGLHRK